jgi:hypothetical protein
VAYRYVPVARIHGGLRLCDRIGREDLAVKQDVQRLKPWSANVPIASNIVYQYAVAARPEPERFLDVALPSRRMPRAHGIDPRRTNVGRGVCGRAGTAEASGKERASCNRTCRALSLIASATRCRAASKPWRGVADVETIDRSFRNALTVGGLCGPFRWIDRAASRRCTQAIRGLPSEPGHRVTQTLQELMDSGARGIANGRGFTAHTEPGSGRALPPTRLGRPRADESVRHRTGCFVTVVAAVDGSSRERPAGSGRLPRSLTAAARISTSLGPAVATQSAAKGT